MKRIASLRTTTLAAMAAALLQASPAGACGYDGAMIDLTAAHPRSIEVALASRDAIDRGELHALPPVAPVLGLSRATHLLEDFRPWVPVVAGAPEGSVAVLLVDAGLWTRYAVTAKGVAAELHVAGPRERELVVVTSEAALRALLDGTLHPERAAELGVLIVVRQP